MWETTVRSELLLNQESSLLNQGGSLFQLLPEYFLAVSGLFFMLSLSALQQEVWKLNYQRPVSYCYLFIVCITGYLVLNDEVLIFGGLTCYSPVNGSLTFFSKLLVCGFSAMYFFVTANFLSDQKIVNFEFLSISLLAVLGLLLLCSSYDLLTAYLAIELISLASYLLASFRKDSHYSVSAGLKYFIIGSVSSAFFLLGSSFIYACSGSIFFLDIHDLFNSKLEFKPSFDKHIEMHEYFATSKQETSELNIKAGGQPKKLLTTKYFYPDSETVAYFKEKVALNFGETLNMDKALTDFTSKDAVMLTKIILLEKKFGLDWQNSVGRPLLFIENFAEAIFKERYKIFDPEVLEAFMRKELPKETFLKLTAKEQSSLIEIATWVDKYQNHPESVLTFLFKNRLTEPLVCKFIFLQHLAAIISVFVHMGMDSASIADLLTELLLNWQNKYGATWIQDVVRYELLKEIPLNIENAYNYIAEKSSINLKENLNQATNSEKDECFGIEQFYHCVCRDVSLRDKEGMPLPVCDKAYPFVKTLRDHKLDLARSLDDEFCNNSLKELKILDALKAKLPSLKKTLHDIEKERLACASFIEKYYAFRDLKISEMKFATKEEHILFWKKKYGGLWVEKVFDKYFLNSHLKYQGICGSPCLELCENPTNPFHGKSLSLAANKHFNQYLEFKSERSKYIGMSRKIKNMQFSCAQAIENYYEYRNVKISDAKFATQEEHILFWKEKYGESWSEKVIRKYFLKEPFVYLKQNSSSSELKDCLNRCLKSYEQDNKDPFLKKQSCQIYCEMKECMKNDKPKKLEAENFELNEYKDLQFVCEYIVENYYDHRHLKTPYAEVLSKEVQIPLWKKAYGEDWAKVVVKEYFLNKPFTVSNLSTYAMEIYFKDIDLEAAAANPESKDGKKLAIKNAAIKKYGPNWAEHLVLLGMANTPLVSSEVLSFFISSHFDNINMDAIKNPGSLERKKAIQLAAWMLHGGPDWLEGLSRNLIIEQQEYSYKKECIEIMGLHFGEVDPKDALFNPNSKDYALINKLRNWARTYGVDWQTTVGAEIIEQIITEKFIRLEVTFDKIISESHGEINYEIALSDVNSKDFKLLMQRLVWAQKYGLNWEEVVVDKIVSKPLPFKSLYKYIIETHYGREKFTNSPEKIWNTSFILNLFEYRVKYGDNWEEKLVSEIIGKPVTRSNIYDFIIDQKYGVVNFDNASENFSLKVVESVVQRLIFKCNYGPNWKEIVSFKIVDSFFNHSYFLSYLSLKKKILPQENFSLSSFKLVQLGILLVLISAFIKLALAPFHLWSLDVYEGSPTSAAFFFAVITKISFFIFMVRFCYASFFNFGLEWQFYIACIATASVFAGSVGGLTQNKLKTLLAYSSISHMGYCALAMCTASLLGIQILLFYLIIYTISGVCTWYILMLLKVKTKKNSKFSKELADLSQLSRSNPALALAFSITMFSLAGLPPFVGFIAKFSVFLSLLKAKFYFICAFAILCSVISTFYYIRIVKVLYFENVLISKLYYPIKTNKVSALSALIFSLIFLFLNPNLLFLIIYDVVYNSFI